LPRTRKYLESRGIWDESQQAKAQEKAKVLVHEVVQAALNVPKPSTDDIFDYVFEQVPEALARQKKTLRTDSIGEDPTQIGLKPPTEPGITEKPKVVSH
jgi:TPP-dependent pyruvate/acetoin dehydrogenase alpha subunit